MKKEKGKKKKEINESRRKFIKLMSFTAIQTTLFLLLGDESFSGCFYRCYTDCHIDCYSDCYFN